ncbi:MAG TPA: tetratricopeptide repeat protein [Burkholderiales bacterium]|jgi:Tfp pilus assembly protein PilF|nr:tetratricopeptide repeat protein [Burkholderiales bacterium]
MKLAIRPLILSLLLAPDAALAAGGDSAPAAAADPVLERASAATARQDWSAAQAILRDAVQRSPANADYHNMYAYAIRKGPSPDMGLAFKHYNEALRIDPKHRGAHEYLGEAYLMVNNLPKAKEQLATLDKLCFFPCGEYSDLKKAIAEYEKKQLAR